MPTYVINRLREELDRRFSKGLSGSRILVVGLAYKKNVDDTRESPALTIIEELKRIGANVAYYDPYLPVVPQSRRHGAISRKPSVSPTQSLLRGLDAALIITDHDCIDYAFLVKNTRLIVDTRNVIAKLGLAEGSSNVVKA